MAIAFDALRKTLQQRTRPLAPLAVSRPDGQTTVVPPPTQSRVPSGTLMQQPRTMTAIAGQLVRRVAPQTQTLAPMAGAAVTHPRTAAPAPARPGQFGQVVRDIQGNERPQQILPGQSATQGLQESAQAAAQRALNNPSPFDDALFKQEVERGREALNADLADRGLSYSTIGSELFGTRVLNPLLSERARGIADARRQALEGAQNVIGQRAGLEAQGRGELRGERGYLDTLREQARRNAIEQYGLQESQLQTTLAQALASGDPSRALAALQSAAYGMTNPALQYGRQAEQTGQSLQDLAQLFGQTFFNGS